MKTTKSILMILVAGALFLSACGQQPTQPGPSATPTPDGSKMVTLDDQGKTIELSVGDSFLLKLGDEYTWDITIGDPSVLSRAMNIAVVRGAQGVYDAHQAGTVTLSAVGDPQCRQSEPPCGSPSIQFTVTVVVK